MDENTSFSRNKSGYIKEFNLFDVFVLNVLGYSIGLAVCTNPPFIAGISPTAGFAAVIFFGALLAVFNGITYGLFSGLMPNMGGDYYFVGRTLHHSLGFIANWGFTFANAFGLAFNLMAFFTFGLGPSLILLGYSFNHPGWTEFGKQVSSGNGSLIWGSVLLWILVLVALSGRSLHRVFLYPLFFIAIIGSVLMGVVLSTCSHADFVSGFNAFILETAGKADAYQQTLQTASTKGLTLGSPSSLRAALHALPIGFLCFVGFNYSVYLGGEVKRPLRSQTVGIIAALLVGLLAFLFLMGKYQQLVSRDFTAALGIGGEVLERNGIPSTSTTFFIGLALPKGSHLNLIMQAFNLLWFVSVPIVILQVCVRNVMTWSREQMFFEAMRWRTKRTFSPWAAILTVAVVVQAWMIANSVWHFSLVGAAALLAIPSALTGLAAFVLRFRRPEFWINAPAKVKTPLFQLSGLLCAIGSGWMVWEAVHLDASGLGGKIMIVWIYILVVYGLGILTYWFFLRRLTKNTPGGKSGVDKFRKQLPPD